MAANNIYDQEVIDLIWDFTLDAEARDEVVSSSSMVNTMGKIIMIDDATPIAPTSDDIVASVNGIPGVDGPDPMMPDDIAKALLRSRDDPTATQLNLRLAPASLDDRAVLVEELEADLQARIDALDLPADSILLVDLPEGQDPVRATPAGLATVGIGLLENLSANRANLTYLALSLAGLFLVLRFRSLTRALLALVPVLFAVGVSSLVVGLLGLHAQPVDHRQRPAGDRELCRVLGADPRSLSGGTPTRARATRRVRHRGQSNGSSVLHLGGHDDLRLRRVDRIGAAVAA